MKDGVIKGTGNSRNLKGAGWPGTYEEFKSMAEAGTLPFDLNGINEAGWQQIGDALSKENLLNDFACKLVGIETTSVPSDAFSKLALGTGKYGYGVTVLFNGSPLAKATVTGISTISESGAVVTDSNGLAVGVSTSASVSITVTPREINLSPKTIAVTATSDPVTYTTINIDELAVGTIVTVSASGVFWFTADVTSADFCLVGGGGSGGRAGINAAIGGGSGGSTTNVLNAPITPETVASVSIGAGGIGVTSSQGNNGGATTLVINGTTYTGTSGKGGSSNIAPSDNGGTGDISDGGSATVYKFGSSSLGYAGGGGGGGVISRGYAGGNPYGGAGTYNGNGSPASGFGGGGGASQSNSGASSGAGYQGVLFVRWRKAA